MAGAAAEIVVRGAAEVERAFLEVRREVFAELRPAIRALAKNVQQDAQTLAVQNITNVGPRWSRMRIGVTLEKVYVAPREHGRRGGSKRPAFGLYLYEQAMEPALEGNKERILRGIDELIALSAAHNGFL